MWDNNVILQSNCTKDTLTMRALSLKQNKTEEYLDNLLWKGNENTRALGKTQDIAQGRVQQVCVCSGPVGGRWSEIGCRVECGTLSGPRAEG